MGTFKTIVIFLLVAVFLLGLAICAFPFVQQVVTDNRLKQDSQGFFDRLETKPVQTDPIEATAPITSECPSTQEESTEPSREHEALWEDMVAYNRRLWEEKQEGLCNPRSYQKPSFILRDYGLENEVFGVISIPRLGLELPLYLGATNAHMADGAAHLSQTSLPIGGTNTNCVIAGHRGWGGASYFRYITELEVGDQVIITNLWKTMTYTVTETQIIRPNDVDKILIQEGRDMITLLTCHPYASGGKQRFLVLCDRVTEYNQQG